MSIDHPDFHVDRLAVLVDAYGQIYRWFYAIPETFKAADGMTVNAIFGIAKFLFKLEEDWAPPYRAFVFDLDGSIERKSQHEEYKCNRKPMPEALRAQLPAIRELIEAFGWCCLDSSGYEADDILATLTKRFPELSFGIVTADKDLAQLVTDAHVHLLLPDRSTGMMLEQGEEEIIERFGLVAQLIPDYLALIGDASDNIPGVSGIGPKTALSILKESGNLKEYLRNPHPLSNEKWQTRLMENQTLILRNLSLIELNFNVPGLDHIRADSLKWKDPDIVKLKSLFEKYNFKSLFNNLTILENSLSENKVEVAEPAKEEPAEVAEVAESAKDLFVDELFAESAKDLFVDELFAESAKEEPAEVAEVAEPAKGENLNQHKLHGKYKEKGDFFTPDLL